MAVVTRERKRCAAATYIFRDVHQLLAAVQTLQLKVKKKEGGRERGRERREKVRNVSKPDVTLTLTLTHDKREEAKSLGRWHRQRQGKMTCRPHRSRRHSINIALRTLSHSEFKGQVGSRMTRIKKGSTSPPRVSERDITFGFIFPPSCFVVHSSHSSARV